jgi:mannose-6-phosphate isomerase-like protein (cupin superfamily)
MSFTEKPWGSYVVLYEHNANVKVKELYVLPGMSLSMQRHACRAEHWFVAQGVATVYTRTNNKNILLGKFNEHELLSISLGDWHQLVNEEADVLKIVEIQYGTHCIEEDIERVFS